MSSLSGVNNGMGVTKLQAPEKSRSASKTENGTDIVMPGKEANQGLFLKMLVSQMQNQDPFNPQDPTQYVTQLSQFTMLEQTMDMNENMKYLMGVGNGLLVNSALGSASGMIGKDVEAYRPVEVKEGEAPKPSDEAPEVMKGVVKGVHVKDGAVYMDVEDSTTGEMVSVEYSSLLKVSDKNIDSKKNI